MKMTDLVITPRSPAIFRDVANVVARPPGAPGLLWALAFTLLAACAQQADDGPPADEQPEAPTGWTFRRVAEDLTRATLTDVWVRSDGVAFATGWDGVILRWRNGAWAAMQVPTRQPLTAIAGVENGAEFGLPAPRGEMLAVGWEGTVLHFHPNPDANPETEDGRWLAVSGPDAPVQAQMQPVQKVDPACPDHDGDGIGDDGDGDGWWGNALCSAGSASECDDNCRTSANGPLRPVEDVDADGCLGPGDGPAATDIQQDSDGDGVGELCDTEPQTPQRQLFDPVLFDVTMHWEGGTLTAVTVGEAGAIATYRGASASTGSAEGPRNPDLWRAQTSLPFRFDNDCPPDTPAGETCAGVGRLPPSCPAQCHPVETTCDCATTSGRCCDPGAPTGAGCGDGSCGPAATGCDAASGECSILCPGCFRRLQTTLRAVATNGRRLLAVGADGTFLNANLNAPTDVWTRPSCVSLPAPLDERPVLAAVAHSGDAFYLSGAAGGLFSYSGSGCGVTRVEGAPQAFFTDVAEAGAGAAVAVGDRGTLFELVGDAAAALTELEVDANLYGVAHESRDDQPPALWIVGATGIILRGEYNIAETQN